MFGEFNEAEQPKTSLASHKPNTVIVESDRTRVYFYMNFA